MRLDDTLISDHQMHGTMCTVVHCSQHTVYSTQSVGDSASNYRLVSEWSTTENLGHEEQLTLTDNSTTVSSLCVCVHVPVRVCM